LIGPDAFGTTSLTPSQSALGIDIRDPGGSATIGGTTQAARNVISGVGDTAVYLQSSSNLVQGNYVGTDRSGTQPLANGNYGVIINDVNQVTPPVTNNLIGGTADGAMNIIAFNTYEGVRYITLGANNQVRRNSIFGNGRQGILSYNPRLTQNGSQGTLSGLLADTPYVIEFFTNPTCPDDFHTEGKTYVTDTTTKTNASGNATVTLPGGQNMTPTPTSTPTPTPSPSPTLGPSPGVLVDLINPGTATGNTFVSDNVDGAVNTVLKFPVNNGVALSPITGAISNNVYTIVMLCKFDEANKVRRLIDFKNSTSDNGLYASADNKLRFNPSATGANNLAAGSYVQVALSRDANGLTTGYLNGTQQFQFTDTNNNAVIDSNNTLRFFQDNLSGGNTARHQQVRSPACGFMDLP